MVLHLKVYAAEEEQTTDCILSNYSERTNKVDLPTMTARQIISVALINIGVHKMNASPQGTFTMHSHTGAFDSFIRRNLHVLFGVCE